MKTSPMSRARVRQVDEIAINDFGMSGLVLMENAGRGAAETIHRISPSGRVVILCGKGNNGGDGYVIARHLQIAGRDVVIVSVASLDGLSGDAAVNASIAIKAGIPIENHFVAGPILVDCLLGTGATGPPRGRYADTVRQANESDSIRYAIDIPTGLDCDSGEVSDPTFRADHTLTFVATKIGFTQPAATPYIGTVHEIGIGVPPNLFAVTGPKP